MIFKTAVPNPSVLAPPRWGFLLPVIPEVKLECYRGLPAQVSRQIFHPESAQAALWIGFLVRGASVNTAPYLPTFYFFSASKYSYRLNFIRYQMATHNKKFRLAMARASASRIG